MVAGAVDGGVAEDSLAGRGGEATGTFEVAALVVLDCVDAGEVVAGSVVVAARGSGDDVGADIGCDAGGAAD